MNVVVTTRYLVQADDIIVSVKTDTRMMARSGVRANGARREAGRQHLERTSGMAATPYIDGRSDAAFKSRTIYCSGYYRP